MTNNNRTNIVLIHKQPNYNNIAQPEHTLISNQMKHNLFMKHKQIMTT